MSRLRLLDLFCGAGGAAVGYDRAGFEVVGIDISHQPEYPFLFIQSDALLIVRDRIHGCWHIRSRPDQASPPCIGTFDVIHASPPCQRFIRGGLQGTEHRDLLTPIRALLERSGLPYVIENVPGAPMRADVKLCGSMFGLPIRRHRWFEGHPALSPWTVACNHSQPIYGVYGHPHGKAGAWRGMLPDTVETRRMAMGIDWMTSAKSLSDAIPPVYTELIGAQLIRSLPSAFHHTPARLSR